MNIELIYTDLLSDQSNPTLCWLFIYLFILLINSQKFSETEPSICVIGLVKVKRESALLFEMMCMELKGK